jgi:superfamily II DNA or RNA helicase
MVEILLPSLENHLFSRQKNYIRHHFGDKKLLVNFTLISINPFVIRSGNIDYLLSNKQDLTIPDEFSHALLVSRKPTKKDFEHGGIKAVKWLIHPNIKTVTPREVLESWKGKFQFIKEDSSQNIPGLRPPQLGALYSILGHLQNADDPGIVVMPTGTGKTETMLCALVANQCEKLLVTVPSDSLRGQLSGKFITLGLLKEFGIISQDCYNPVVGIMSSRITEIAELEEFISKVNVVVTTMSIVAGGTLDVQEIMASQFSHLFVDEAHHSEADTWQSFINKFEKQKVFLFTATPYRNDGKKLTGKFIFNFSLKKAQQQRYYKTINYLPIREYDREKADQMIADKAVQKLRKDLAQGFQHIILARCLSKDRANDVFRCYEHHRDLKPILVYTNKAGLSDSIKAIRRKEHLIIICVDMLGEGFDLPELKIAAIHDERQSLPITLQFIGRFTRASYNQLGEASFITNAAYPPIKEELDQLYAKDTDWNLLLPILSEAATQKEINFKEFLNGFNGLDQSIIPFQNINPALSTVMFRNAGNEWSPNRWKEGMANLNSYEHQYSSLNPHNKTLVIILGKVSRVEWGSFDTVQNLEWDMIVVFWDFRPNVNRIFVNTSIKSFPAEKLVEAIFGNQVSKITGMNVFRIFHEVHRLSLFNVGGRKGIGQDISFQSFYGKGVQDGLDMLLQGTLIKNNIFGVGYKDGNKVSLGCSVKGKIWSYLRGNLDELIDWCKTVGDVVENPDIDPNTVLQHTLQVMMISTRPDQTAIAADWHPEMYKFSDARYEIYINGIRYFLWDIDLEVDDRPIKGNLQFSLATDQVRIVFELVMSEIMIEGELKPTHKINKITNIDARIHFGAQDQDLAEYFQNYTPIIWFADGAQLLQNQYIKPRERAATIPLDKIISQAWPGVALNRESQGVAPYRQDSIQYYFINQLFEDFELIYDGDGKGEIADIIGINDSTQQIDIHMFHLKYAKKGAVGNDIDNLFQVCGQAQKSINWKYRAGREFFEHLFRKITKTENGVSCSRLIKGTETQLETLLTAAKWTKTMKFHMYIVQPGFAKNNVSDDILLLLGNTYHYLHTVGNIELKVYSS